MTRTTGLRAALLASVVMATACHHKPDFISGGPRPPPTATVTSAATPAPTQTATSPTPLAVATGAPTAAISVIKLPAPRYRTMGAAVGTDVFVLGGLDAAGVSSSDVYRITPATGRVALAGHLATPTHGGAAVALGNRILVFGGAGTAPQDLVQSFDPATGATTVVGHLPGARADLVATAVGNEILVLAGFDGSQLLTDILATADGTSFHKVGALRSAERYPAVAVVGTTVFLFGGLVSGAEYSGTFSTMVQSYNISTGISKIAGTLSTPLSHARSAVLAEQVFVIGGWIPTGPSSAIQRFDPQNGSLTPAGRLPGPVADEAAATVGNTAWLAGGIAASALTDVETVTAAS